MMADTLVGNVRVETRADGLDIAQLGEMTRSRGWEMVCGKIDRMIREEQKTLETVIEGISVARAQGRIAALRVALRLPEILKSEFEQEKKKR